MRSNDLEITVVTNYMKFVTECQLPANKSSTIKCPILTKQSHIPCKITITEVKKGGEEAPVSGIHCRVHAGGQEICNLGESTFRISNEIDLSKSLNTVQKTGNVVVVINSRHNEPKRLKVYTEYTRSYGGVLFEEKSDHFENLLKDIHSKGFCTRLVMSFNKEITNLEFASVAECLDNPKQWIMPFNVPIDSDLDLEDQIYTIDFTSPTLGVQYSEHLDFLETRVAAKNDKDNQICYMYVTAYGFPHNQ